MPMQASTDVAEVAIEAIRAHGRRASIARGWANLSLIDDADGDHRTPVHGRRQTAAVRDGSLELPPRPGCPYSGTTLSRKALRGFASISKELAREYRSSRVCSSGSRLCDFT